MKTPPHHPMEAPKTVAHPPAAGRGQSAPASKPAPSSKPAYANDNDGDEPK